MSSINLTLFQLLKTEFKLSDEKAIQFVEALKEEQETSLKLHSQDFKSSVREDFLQVELKIEQVKSELLKWYIGGFMTLVLMLIGMFVGLYFK